MSQVPAQTKRISKKKKFVADGLFEAELNAFFQKELAEDGYSGMEVRPNPTKRLIIIRATKTKSVLGEKSRRIRELASVIEKRWNLPEDSIQLFADRTLNKGLSALAQAESLRSKLLGGLAVRRACYGVIRFIMENEAKGCEVIVSGKLRGQRAKAMKFREGYMIKSGQPSKTFTDFGVRHVLLRQGVLGIKVKIMLPHDPKGRKGPTTPLPDVVKVLDTKEESREQPEHKPRGGERRPRTQH